MPSEYAIARPFTHTQSGAPDYTESMGLLYISAHQGGAFSNFGPTSGYEWWNGPDEIPGYVIATYVPTFDHTTPDGNVGNVKFWRTRGLYRSQFIDLGSGILGSAYTNDDVLNDLEGNEYWSSYKYTIFYGGDFTKFRDEDKIRFGALRKTDGELDLQPNDYNWGNLNPEFNNSVLDIYHKPDGKMLVSGLYTESFGSSRSYLIQIDPVYFMDDGLIRSFNNLVPHPAECYVNKSIYNENADGIIVSVGRFSSYDGGSSAYITGINDSDGSEDTRFGSGLNGEGICIDQDSNGTMFVGGNFTDYNGTSCTYLIGIKPNGGAITGFTSNVVLNDSVFDIKVSSDDSYFIAVGQFTGSIMKYDIINATVSNIFSAFNNRAFAVDIAVDGAIIVGGNFTAYGATSVTRICKINPDGTVNSTFASNIGTGFNAAVNDVKCLPDGSILVAGAFTTFNGNDSRYIAKLDKNGNPISDWSTTVSFGADSTVRCVSPR